jgi:hypothetical protein
MKKAVHNDMKKAARNDRVRWRTVVASLTTLIFNKLVEELVKTNARRP